jgi:hypothetical protein
MHQRKIDGEGSARRSGERAPFGVFGEVDAVPQRRVDGGGPGLDLLAVDARCDGYG